MKSFQTGTGSIPDIGAPRHSSTGSNRKRLTIVGQRRPRTETLTNKEEQAIWKLLYPDTNHWRPKTRADCAQVPRPCPYVGCRYNLYLEEASKRSIRYIDPELEPWDVDPACSCALDIAEKGDHTLEEVGDFFKVTRERIRQIEKVAFAKINQLLNLRS